MELHALYHAGNDEPGPTLVLSQAIRDDLMAQTWLDEPVFEVRNVFIDKCEIVQGGMVNLVIMGQIGPLRETHASEGVVEVEVEVMPDDNFIPYLSDRILQGGSISKDGTGGYVWSMTPQQKRDNERSRIKRGGDRGKEDN